MDNVVITEVIMKSKEGVIIRLNKPTSLKTGNIVNNEFYVSWDKIGNLLFDNYASNLSVPEMNDLREG